MTDGQDVKDSVNSLLEEFTELEADLPTNVYKALSPHIQKVADNLDAEIERLKRINHTAELITILSSGRIVIREEDLNIMRRAMQNPEPDHVVFRFDLLGQEIANHEEEDVAPEHGPIPVRRGDYEFLIRELNLTPDEIRGIGIAVTDRDGLATLTAIRLIRLRLEEYRRREREIRGVRVDWARVDDLPRPRW